MVGKDVGELGEKNSALPQTISDVLRTLRESSTQRAAQKSWHGNAISLRKIAELHITYLDIPGVRSMKYCATIEKGPKLQYTKNFTVEPLARHSLSGSVLAVIKRARAV